MSIFDSIAKVAVNTTDALFAYTAVWNGFTAKVKYRELEGDANLGDVKFNLDKWQIEFKDVDFPGLKAAINRNKKEPITVTVRGTAIEYLGVTANAVSDGMLTQVKMRIKSSSNNGYSSD